jgi:hypothetical protein
MAQSGNSSALHVGDQEVEIAADFDAPLDDDYELA